MCYLPLLQQTYSVKNSAQFVTMVNDLRCNNLHFFVSFDVVSLFTSIPTRDVLNLIFRLLNQDNTLCDRTNFSVNEIIKALSICLKSTVFLKNVLYRQIFGVTMGSCILPILADIFMEFVEHRAISTFHTPSKLWVRYVDDIFCLIELQYAEEFHKHLNRISPSITFTLEREQNQSMAFLDVKVTRNKDNTISTTIYKKPSHTNRYLQFDSHHPKHHKFAVAIILYYRIDTHATNSDNKATLHKKMQHTLTLNGFPLRFSCLALKENPRRPVNSFKSFTCLPYIHGTTDKIQCVLNDVGVRVSMRPFTTIGKSLPSPKDPLDVNQIRGVFSMHARHALHA